MYVADLAGNGDVTQVSSGETLYIKVTDNDRNSLSTTLQTIPVTLTTQKGDSLTITLTETGVNTGIFTGSILPVSGTVVTGDGILQVAPGETVTVTYIDIITANLSVNIPRTDVIATQPPIISVAKVVDFASVVSGATVTYTFTITNSGSGDAILSTVKDTLPGSFSYINNTTTGLTTANPVISGQNLTWNGNWIVPRKTGVLNGSLTLVFKAKALGTTNTYYNSILAIGANINSVTTGMTAPVTIGVPQMTMEKSVDSASVDPGAVITYTVHYRNVGTVTAKNIVLTDSIPAGSAYVPGSLRMGNAGSTYITAAAKTDVSDGDEAEIASDNVVFRITTVDADDSVPDAGTDEGKVYFQVIIN